MAGDDVIDAGMELDGVEAPPDLGEAAVLPRLLKIPGGVPDLDGELREAQKRVAGAPLKFRLQPAFYFKDNPRYTRYTHVCWIVELTAEQVVELRQDLDAFVQGWVRAKQGEQEGR